MVKDELPGGSTPLDALNSIHEIIISRLKAAGLDSVTGHLSNPDPGGFQIDAEELRQQKHNAADTTHGPRTATIPPPEQGTDTIMPVSSNKV